MHLIYAQQTGQLILPLLLIQQQHMRHFYGLQVEQQHQILPLPLTYQR